MLQAGRTLVTFLVQSADLTVYTTAVQRGEVVFLELCSRLASCRARLSIKVSWLLDSCLVIGWEKATVNSLIILTSFIWWHLFPQAGGKSHESPGGDGDVAHAYTWQCSLTMQLDSAGLQMSLPSGEILPLRDMIKSYGPRTSTGELEMC